jgi:tetratricopeptide (TPR) repeat protein
MKHKKIILFFILLIWLTGAGSAAEKDDFSLANSHYEAGRYGEALKIYQRLNRQLTNWQVLYNIGNCYFKLDQPLAAKVNYLRARKFQPLNQSIAKNIAIVNKSFKDIIAPETPDFISRTIQVLQARLSLNTLSLLLLAAILLLNLFLFLLLKKGRRKKIIYGLAFSLFLSLALGALHYNRVSSMRQTSIAVVNAENSVLRSGPGASNTELFKINPGLEVKILDRSRDWVQVSASPQVAGWIELINLTLI